MSDEFSEYFSGQRLYGDDFTIEQIREWYEDEAEGYADLGAGVADSYRYEYHRLNMSHGYRYIGDGIFNEVLGFGSAYGEELRPIAKQLGRVTILDPSDSFSSVQEINGTPIERVKPSPVGRLPFADGHFNLITCFGVMHHIPNVTYVLSECLRCLADQGLMVLREPINSMGDWRKPRSGLTKRERGIPLNLLDNIVRDVGFDIRHRSLCDFSPVPRLAKKWGVDAYNNSALTLADSFLSKMFAWNIKYHRTKLYEKLAPASVFYVLER